jgi:ketosteroid isomerase-like protein
MESSTLWRDTAWAMSQEQVEVVREHIEAARRDDVSVSMSFLDPHVVFDPSRYGGLDVGTAYGHEAFAHAVRHYVGAFEDFVYEVDRLTDLGSGAVLAVVTETGRGKGSGAPVERHFAALYTVIDGKITRITFFPSESEALEAAGLQE